jgi:hypothetical protein
MLEIVDPFNAVNFSADSARFETGATVVVIAVVGVGETGATVVVAGVVGLEETGATVVAVGDGLELGPPENSNRLGVFVATPLRTFRVEESRIQLVTSEGLSSGFPSSARAATPATCGAAIEVPLRLR